MIRKDEGLAFMLKYENVAWYESGKVKILDRRVYPTKVEFVTCTTHEEVAQAIHDMVTQSAGPYTAADSICLDGHVVNKIGTYQIAIVAKYHGVPYFVTGIPDR